jgi:electron transfer flavoprotein beta subunit
VFLVSLSPKAKLQQVMMTVAQKVPFELVALDGPAGGFTEPAETAALLAEAIQGLPGLDKSRLLVFGGWESASRGAGATLQMVGERLGVSEQFQGVDQLKIGADGSLEILERIEGGRHQVSRCAGPPALLGWATGNLPEPKNNPQVGMMNMRAVMPALQKARPVKVGAEGVVFSGVSLPKQQRQTRIVKDASADDIAKEIIEWIRK